MSEKVKYREITLDENLTWTEHYKELKCNIKSALSSLQELKNILSQPELDQVYKALIESHLRCSDELWSNLSNTQLEHLQHLQNRAKTLIENSRLKYVWRCNWLSVSNIIQFYKAILIYKIVIGLCPHNLKGKVIREKFVGTTELHYSTKKREYSLSILRAFFVRHSSEYETSDNDRKVNRNI